MARPGECIGKPQPRRRGRIRRTLCGAARTLDLSRHSWDSLGYALPFPTGAFDAQPCRQPAVPARRQPPRFAGTMKLVVVSLEKDVLALLEDMPDFQIIGFFDARHEARDARYRNLGPDAQWPLVKVADASVKVVLAIDP